MRRAVIRADSARHIGAGHVMRCLTLADALAARGMETIFVGRPFPEDMTGLIEMRGHRCLRLSPSTGPVETSEGPAHAGWLGVTWEQDRDETAAVLEGLGPVDLMIVDHYGLDERWERALARHVGRILVIDDLVDRAHACAILVDQTVGRQASEYRSLISPDTTVLAGPRFAMLAPAFGEARRGPARPVALPTHLLISFGSVDAEGYGLTGLEAAMRLPERLVDRISVVTTDLSAHSAELEDLARLDARVSLARNVRDMPAFLGEIDIALGAAGVSALERCALGIPQVIAVIAANQRGNASGLAEAGAALLLSPDGGKIDAEAIGREIARLLESPTRLAGMADAARSLVDGKGTERVARCALAAGIDVRQAN